MPRPLQSHHYNIILRDQPGTNRTAPISQLVGLPGGDRLWQDDHKGAPTLRIVTRGPTMAEQLENIHPGEVLLEEFLLPMGISQNGLARAIDVPPCRINQIVQG